MSYKKYIFQNKNFRKKSCIVLQICKYLSILAERKTAEFSYVLLLGYVALVEVNEENQASHRLVGGRGSNIFLFG